MSKYYDQASQQYNPSYNNKVQALQNQLNQNQQALEQQKGGINQNYDQQVGNANLNNKMNKNNVSNAMLGRGLGNSSIAVSGLAGQDAKNTRIVGQIEQGRLSDLNNIDQQKTMLGQNHNNMLLQMQADKEDAIWALARQLEDRDWDKGFKDKQLAMQQAQADAEASYRQQQLGLSWAQHNASEGWKAKEWEQQNALNQAYMDYYNSLMNPSTSKGSGANTYGQSGSVANSTLNRAINGNDGVYWGEKKKTNQPGSYRPLFGTY